MRSFLRIFFVCVVSVAGINACLSPRPAPDAVLDPAGIRRDVSYGPGDWQLADIYFSSAEAPSPAVILVHGGSWARGNRRRIQRVAVRAVERGYVAVNIEYRLAPTHQFPAPIGDLLQAVCWVKQNADALGVDPDRVAFWGYSAGAHLSMVAASRPEWVAASGSCPALDARVRAAVVGAGPSDLRLLDVRPVRDLLGGDPEDVPQVYADASPILLVDGQTPPIFLYHGRNDWIVDIEQSRQLHSRIEAVGGTVEIFETDHGHMSQNWQADMALTRGFDFLDRWMGDPRS